MTALTVALAGWTPENIAAAIGILVAAGGMIILARKVSCELEDLDVKRLTVAGWVVTVVATICGLVAGGFVFIEMQHQPSRARILFAVIAGFDMFAAVFLGCRWIFGLRGFSMLKELPVSNDRQAHVFLEESRDEDDR